MRIRSAVAGVTLLLCASAQGETFTLIGFLTGRAVAANGPPTWLEGGFGRMQTSGNAGFAIAQIGGEYEPNRYFDAHLQTIARAEPSNERGKRVGVVEAFVDGRTFIHNDELQLRLGQFFPNTSRENTGQFWTNPYLITDSTWNTWIGDEFRPIGADLQWKHTIANTPNVVTAAVTAFRGNDTAGTLIAWRGFTVGNRLSVFNERLPLPPLFSFKDPAGFEDQRHDGTAPFERDLDGRTGYAERIRFAEPDRWLVQISHADNRGDRKEYRGEYAWATRFTIVGGELGSQDTSSLVSEYAWGRTAAGEPTETGRTESTFYAAYLLYSKKFTKTRFSARLDRFATHDKDHTPFEDSTEHGWAGAVGGFYYPAPHWRTGMEFTRIIGNRPAAAQSGFNPNMDANSVTLEVRYSF